MIEGEKRVGITESELATILLLVMVSQSAASLEWWGWGASALLTVVIGQIRYGARVRFYRALGALALAGASYLHAVSQLPKPQAVQRVRSWNEEAPFTADISGVVQGPVLRNVRGEVRATVAGTAQAFGESVQGVFFLRAPNVPWEPSSRWETRQQVKTVVKVRHDAVHFPPVPPFSFAGYLYRRGVLFSGEVEEGGRAPGGSAAEEGGVLWRLFAREVRLDDERAYAVLIAAVLGHRDRLGSELNQLFRETSTSHLIVVSGFHVGLLFLLSMRFVRAVGGRSERLCLMVPLQRVGAAVGVGVCWAYTHLVGYDVTTARALVVIVIYGLAKLLGRVGSDLRTFLLSALAVVLLWPGCFFEIGFHLTFAALWGLMLASRLLSPLREGLLTQWVVKPFMQSVGASLCTAPVLLCWFNTLVPLSPVINLIAGPYFTVVCILGGGVTLAALVLGLPFSGEMLWLNCELTEWFLDALERGNGALTGIGLGMWTFTPLAAWSLAALIAGIVFVLSFRAWGLLPQNQNHSAQYECADHEPLAKVSLLK